MPDPIVIDTGPLILLAKIDALSCLEKLPYTFVCPQAVLDELEEGAILGYQQVEAPCLRVLPSPVSIHTPARTALGDGEAAVIQLALEQRISLVCLDDLRARHMAKTVGLQPVGLLGLLAKAKMLDLIPELAPYIDRLLEAGARYAPELISKILRKAGE